MPSAPEIGDCTQVPTPAWRLTGNFPNFTSLDIATFTGTDQVSLVQL